MVEDLLVEGDKGIAALLGVSVETVRRQRATYPDPLPARRLRRGRGGGVWVRRERLRLWQLRHAKPVVGDLPMVTGRLGIARFVRLSVRQCRRLLPWTSPPVRDPLPVWRDAAGHLRAYRDALLDWLDRQSEPSAAPRYQRRWESNLVTKRKRRARSEGEPVRRPPASAREVTESTAQKIRQEGSKGPAQKVRVAA